MDGIDGHFVHPVRDEHVMAGNGTIGLELVEDLDEIDAVVIPWGGGGLTTGIASALAALRPETPRRRRRARDRCARRGDDRERPACRSRSSTRRRSSTAPARARCCRTCGSAPSRSWSAAFSISLADAASAVRVLAERARIVAEGAAGLAVAAALAGHAGTGRVVCIVCGGNIDPARLAAILDGRVPD